MKFKETFHGDLTKKKTNGYIDISSNKIKITSLEGCPKEINGSFHCSFNNIASLEHSPEIINGEFNRSFNNIKTLFGMPKKVRTNFIISGNKIRNFIGFDNKQSNNFYIFRNNITSLKGLPEEVDVKILDCSYNKLKDLSGGVKIINGDFKCNNNNLKTLKGSLKKIKGTFDCSFNKDLKNQKNQIIENRINRAEKYITDEGEFKFVDIKNFFIKNNNIEKDYGVSLC